MSSSADDVGGGWTVEWTHAPARELHARPMSDPPARLVTFCEVSAPAVVLGSAQSDDAVDHRAVTRRGVEVARRRGGGGAVHLVPGAQSWIDLEVPRGDALWHDDVGRAFEWVGELWAGALADLGVDAQVHRGALVRTPWSGRACFAGLGPGEVRTDGRKLVGMSQRRTRAAARFQCVVYERFDPDLLGDVLVARSEDRGSGDDRSLRQVLAQATTDLAGAAGPGRLADLERRLLARLDPDGPIGRAQAQPAQLSLRSAPAR